MTPKEALSTLEALKDHTNDQGKRDIEAVQNAIKSWPLYQPAASMTPLPETAYVPPPYKVVHTFTVKKVTPKLEKVTMKKPRPLTKK